MIPQIKTCVRYEGANGMMYATVEEARHSFRVREIMDWFERLFAARDVDDLSVSGAAIVIAANRQEFIELLEGL